MEDFDYAPEFAQFQPPPPAPDPYTSADDLRLQRLNQGLSHVQSEVDDGTLDPNEADELARMIHFQRAPLLAKQEAAKKMARSEQQQQLLEMNATQQSLMQADAANDARNFQARTATYTDPLTGRSKHFFQTTMGNWSPIDFDQEANPEEGLPGGKTEGANEGTGEGGQLTKNADGTHTLTIYNGQNREVITFANGKTIGRQQFDREGREVIPWQQTSQAQEEEYRRRAEQIVGKPPPEVVQDRFGRIGLNPLFRDWERKVGDITRDLVSRAGRAQQHATDFESQTKLNEQRAKLKQEQDLTASQVDAIYQKELDRLHKARAEWKKDHDGSLEGAPDYLTDEDAMEAKAMDKAKVRHKNVYPHRYDSKEEAQQTKEQVKDVSTPAQAVKPEKGAATLAQLLKEKKRREAAKAAQNPVIRSVPGPDPNPATGFRTISKF